MGPALRVRLTPRVASARAFPPVDLQLRERREWRDEQKHMANPLDDLRIKVRARLLHPPRCPLHRPRVLSMTVRLHGRLAGDPPSRPLSVPD